MSQYKKVYSSSRRGSGRDQSVVCICSQETDFQQEVGPGNQTPKSTRNDSLPPVSPPCTGFTAFQNRPGSWGASVQMQELTGDISHANQTEVIPVGSLRLHHCFDDRVKCRTRLPKGVNAVSPRSSGRTRSLVWGHSPEIPSNTAACRLLGPEGGSGARWLSLPSFRILASFNLHNTA